MDQSASNEANGPSLNSRTGCIKVVDTFRLIHRIAGIQKRAWCNHLESLKGWVLTPPSSAGQNLPCPPPTTIRFCHSRCHPCATRRCPPPGAGRNFRRWRVRCRHNRRPAASVYAGTGRAIHRVRGKLHRHGNGDPSAPSRVNFRGVCVSSSLARRATGRTMAQPRQPSAST